MSSPKNVRRRKRIRRANRLRLIESTHPMRTLTIDIGGTGIKMLPIGPDGESVQARDRELTPRPALPEAIFGVIEMMLARHSGYDRVSVGFPGVVVRGVVKTAPNLDTAAWVGVNLQEKIHALTDKPVRAMNDADLQGYGVIEGTGVELVLTLGTGLGSALYSDGHLVANLELAHHPFQKDKTYEERISDAERKRCGNKKWVKRVMEVIRTIDPIFNYERLYIGGGNAKRLDPATLPPNATIFTNEDGMEGGVRLWDDALDDE